jgi:hypothetical protein
VAVEAYSVMYGDDGGPEIGHAALRLPDGAARGETSPTAPLPPAMTREEFCGRPRAIGERRHAQRLMR